MKVGLIDIGSNTTKVLIAEKGSGLHPIGFTLLAQSSLPCRLFSNNPEEKNILGQDQAHTLIKCLLEFQNLCIKHGVDVIQAVATEAFRKSSNSSEIASLIEGRFSFKLKILSGAEEASGVAKGLQTDPNVNKFGSYTALDIGGGSMEFILVNNQKLENVLSLPLGAVQVAKSDPSFAQQPIALKNQEMVRCYIREAIREELPLFRTKHPRLVGTGGTLVFCRKILNLLHKTTKDGSIHKSDIEKLAQTVCALSLQERIDQFPDLPPDRADIFPYGLLTVLEIMNFFEVQEIIHSYHNLRYGLVQEIMESA